MKTKLVVATLLAGSSLFAQTHFSIGIGVGGHGYATPPVVAYRPHYPGPGYVWVDGYWDQVGPRRFWREGNWSRQSYGRSYAISPRYDSNRNNRNGYGNGYTANSYNSDGYDGSRSNATSPRGNSYNGNSNGVPAIGNSPNGNFSSGNGSGRNGNRFDNSNGRR